MNQVRSNLDQGKKYKSPLATLRRLAKCDMHLVLPGARQSELFEESWIELCSLLATREIAKTGELSRKKALRAIASRIMLDLDLRSIKSWTRQEQETFVHFCPVIAAAEPGHWTAREKKALINLMRAKGGQSEINYARGLREHKRLFVELKKRCRQIA